MNRLRAPNSVAFAGRDIAPTTGTPQYATDGEPGITPPTIWPAYAFNMIQDEIIAVLVAAGVVLDDTNWGQLIAALRILFGVTGVVGSPGWTKLPNGLILQQGVVTLPTNGLSATATPVTFPLAFPTALFVAACNATTTANGGAFAPSTSALSGTRSGFSLRGDTLNPSVPFTNAVGCNWLALGN